MPSLNILARLALITALLGLLPFSLSAQPEPTGKPKVRRGLMSGKGSITWPDGSRYEGAIKDKQPSGTGTMTYRDGAVYKGGWWKGKRHGTGNIKYAGGSTYSGQWRNGYPHGKGIRTQGDTIYDGGWKGGRKEGTGKLTTGKFVYEGEWKNDYPHGRGKRKWFDGQSESGTYKRGRVVEGMRDLSNGLREGTFSPDTGKLISGTRTLPDKTRYNGFFGGEGDGYYFLQGRVIGPDGELVRAGYWSAEDGSAHGYLRRHDLKDLEYDESIFEAGTLNGWAREQLRNGILKVGQYREGKQHGYWVHLWAESPLDRVGSTIQVFHYENGKSSSTHSWQFSEPHFKGRVSWKVETDDAKFGWFEAAAVDAKILYLGIEADADGRPTGTAPALFLGAIHDDFIDPEWLSNVKTDYSHRFKDLFIVSPQSTWEEGRLVSAELGDRSTRERFYVGEVDDRGRRHGEGWQSRVSVTPGTTWTHYDHENLEPVTYEHGQAMSSNSATRATDQRMATRSQKVGDSARRNEERRLKAERAEERERVERRQADLARREAQDRRVQEKADAVAERWNQAQSDRDYEAREFQRDVAHHNRNLADAFEDTRRAQEAARAEQAELQAAQVEQQRQAIAAQDEARRLEQERQQLEAAARKAEQERLAAAEEAERERLAAVQAEREQLAAAQAEREQSAAKEAESRSEMKTSGPPAPTGLTPPPGRLPEVPERGYSAWTRYAEARDGGGDALLRLEYRIRITTGLGDEPYVNVAWRLTNLSDRPIYDASVTDKVYSTNLGTKRAGSGESFKSTLSPGETDANLPDVMEGARLENFQLEQPGIRLKLERGGSTTHWQNLGVVTYF